MKQLTQRQLAITAGIALLLMAIFAPIATSLFGKTGVTVSNVRLGTFAFMMVVVFDIVVAWALYLFFRNADKQLSLLAALFRIVYSGALLVSLYPLVAVISANGASLETAIKTFNANWGIALFIFGFHLLTLGWLIIKTASALRWIGILVLMSGAGYLADSVLKVLVENINFELSIFTFIGEVVLMIWLLIKGGKKNFVESEQND